MIEDTEYADEVLLWITKVKKDGQGVDCAVAPRYQVFTAPSKGSSKRDTGFPFSLIPTSERQISPAKMTGRSVEVQRKRGIGRIYKIQEKGACREK